MLLFIRAVSASGHMRIGSSSIFCGVIGQQDRLLKKITSVLLLGLLLLLCAAPGQAEGTNATLVLSERGLWTYAEKLFAQGEYYRAITEYKRLAHFFPRTQRAWPAQLRIAEAHLLGHEPEQALQLLQRPFWQNQALLALYDPPYRRQLHNARMLLMGMSWLEHQSWLPYPKRPISRGVHALHQIDQSVSQWGKNTEDFVLAMQQAERKLENQFKSPALAGGLSALLPGAGSVYLGRYREGLLTAFFTLGLAAGANRALNRGKDSSGTVIGLGALAFYGGGIYVATSGAHKHNARLYDEYLNTQRMRYGLALRPRGWLMTWELLSPPPSTKPSTHSQR